MVYYLYLFLQLYISRNNYPKWTPVTIVTEGVEAQEFAAHFSSWSWANLSQGQRSAELCLPVFHPPSITYPATGQTKVCVCVYVQCIGVCLCLCEYVCVHVCVCVRVIHVAHLCAGIGMGTTRWSTSDSSSLRDWSVLLQ